MKAPLTPRCYVCGQVVGAVFMLFALSQGVDRVFVVHLKCSKQLDGAIVREVKAK